MRNFKHSSTTNVRLAHNAAHSYAMNHAFGLFNLDALYTFIPKNACSTLRWSAAVSNGICSENGDVNWIHKNTRAFNPSLEFAIKARYAFVVLRCPYRRLASAFLDKAIHATGPVRKLVAGKYYLLTKPFGQRFYDRLTFLKFCKAIARQNTNTLDGHWRPQSDFLLFSNYDDYFCVEEFDKAREKLSEIGLRVLDTRARLEHNASRFQAISGRFSSLSCAKIRTMQQEGKVPSYASLYDDECRSIVDSIYKTDISLFKEKFGAEKMLVF